jgi:hypothetical protein
VSRHNLVASLVALLLAGCGGGSSHAAPTPFASSTPGVAGGAIAATFTVQLPSAAQVSSHERGLQYVSSATQKIFLFVEAPTSPTYTFLNSATCSATACTISQGFNPGTYSIALGLRDSTGTTTYSSGRLLATIQPDTANTFSTVFYAAVAAIHVTATQTQIPNGVRTAIPLNLALFDAAGNQIIGPGAIPLLSQLQFAVSDTSGTTTVVPSTITGADVAANLLPSLVYSGGVPSSSTVTVSATTPNMTALIAGSNVAPTFTPLSLTVSGIAPTFTSSATAGVTSFQQSGTAFENFIAAASQTVFAIFSSGAEPAALATPSATFPTGGLSIAFNAGTSTFSQQRTLTLDRHLTAGIAPANGFKPDQVFTAAHSQLHAAAASSTRRAHAESLPVAGTTRTWNIVTAPISGGTPTNSGVTMTLVAVSAHGYIWLDNSLLSTVPTSSANAQLLGQMFDAVYTSDTTIFGSADYTTASPGNGTFGTCLANGAPAGASDTVFVPDATPRMINVLIPQQSSIGAGEGGYFSAGDLENQDIVNCYNANGTTSISNQASAIVIGSNAGVLSAISSPTYVRSAMAHELQHLIHFVNHEILIGGTDDPSWLDEGMAMVAEDLTTTSGIDVVGTPFAASAFLSAPYNFSLTAFTGLDASAVSYSKNCTGCYGQSYLFARYLVDRFGIGIMRTLTQTGTSGVANVVGATGVDFGTLVGDFDTALAVSGTGIVPTNNGTRYALSIPIGGTFQAGSDEANLSATYPPLERVNVPVPAGGVSFTALLGAPIFFKLNESPGTAAAVKVTDLSNGSLLLYPTLAQK